MIVPSLVNYRHHEGGSSWIAVILNTTPKKSGKIYRWNDFYPDRKEKKEMTNEEIAEKLHGMFGGK